MSVFEKPLLLLPTYNNKQTNKQTNKQAILIGKGGLKLKELGVKAREGLESFLNRKIFLSLRVRVDADWRTNEEALQRYGYLESDFG